MFLLKYIYIIIINLKKFDIDGDKNILLKLKVKYDKIAEISVLEGIC